MPRLPKFKDYHVSPLTGPMNSLTPLDLLNDKQFRYVKNLRVDGIGRLKRAGGLKALFDDGNYNVGGAIKNNSDLHDQLGSKQTPTNTIREPITLLFEFESGSGSRKLIAATKSRIYALNQRSRNWILIGDNGGAGYSSGTSSTYSSTKFKAAQLGNNIIFTNNYDQPLNWFFDSNPDRTDKNLAITIPDLVKLKITKAAHLSEYKGFMFLGDLEEASTNQVSKVQWSDYVDATSYYPSLASLAGQQTVGDLGERIIGMSVLGDHLMIYKERSIWRCSLVSSSNLFVFKQVYQGENTPFYEDTLVNTGDAHFYMSETGIYRMTLSSLKPQRVDWMHNAAGIIFEDEVVSGEDGIGPRHITGGIKNLEIDQEGAIASVSSCPVRPPVITAHPGNLTINANPCSASYTSSTSLTVTVTGKEPFAYQWQERQYTTTWSNISGENESILNIDNPSAKSNKDKQFRVVVTNSDGTVNSNHGSVTLAGFDTVPSFTTVMSSQDQQSSVGDDVTIEARWCTAVTSWTWKSKLPSGSYSNVTIDGTNFTEESGLVPPIGSTAGYYFSRITIKNIQSSQNGVKYKINAVNPAGNTDSGETTIFVTVATGGSAISIRSEGEDRYPVIDEDRVGWEYESYTAYAENGRGTNAESPYPLEGVFYPSGESFNDARSDGPFHGNDYSDYAVYYPPFKWQVLGGTAPFKYEVYRTNDTHGIKTAEAKALVSNPSTTAVTLAVEKTHTWLSVGDVLKFNATDGTAVFTLTQQASHSSTTLTGYLTGAALQDDLVSIRHWNSNDQPVTKFKNNTCDLTAYTITGCTLNRDSANGTTAVTGFSGFTNIAAGQRVTGTYTVGSNIHNIPDETFVLESPAPAATSCTLNKAVPENASSVTLIFTTNKITCDSNNYIEVGQRVSGTGIPSGSIVQSLNPGGTAPSGINRAVTSFTITTPVTITSSQSDEELTFTPKLDHEFNLRLTKTKNEKDTAELSFNVFPAIGVKYESFKYPISGGLSGDHNFANQVGYEPMFRLKITDSSSSPISSFSEYKWLNVYPSSTSSNDQSD
jgi:hypothetical protein